MMETIQNIFTADVLIIWAVFSILVSVVWGFLVIDGVEEREGKILTSICAVLALPVTLVVIIVMAVAHIFADRARYK